MNKIEKSKIKTMQILRQKGGPNGSIKNIAKKLNCSPSTVRKYVNHIIPNIPIPQNLHQPKATLKLKEKWEVKKEEIRQEAISQWDALKTNPEFLALIAQYWGEGTKRTKDFNITNSDPGFICAALKALQELGDFEYDIAVSIYPIQDLKTTKEIWERILKMPVKVRVKKWRSKKEKLYSKYGVCTLRIRKSFEIWHKIMQWIDCWREEFGIKDNFQL